MGQVELVGTSFCFRHKDGRLEKLLDTQAYLENHSRIMMHCPEENAEFGFTYPLVDKIIPLWQSLQTTDDCDKIIFLRIAANMLERPFAKKILFIGGTYYKQLAEFAKFIKNFHPDNKVYWNRAEMSEIPDGIIEYRQPFSELLLPAKSFAVIVVADNLPQTKWLPEFKEQILLALRWDGILFHRQQESIYADKSFSLVDGNILHEWHSSKERWQICHRESIAGMVDEVRAAIDELICQIEELINVNDIQTQNYILKLYPKLAEYILTIYPLLGDCDIKQALVYWHEKIIDWQLGNEEDIRAAFGIVKAAWEKC